MKIFNNKIYINIMIKIKIKIIIDRKDYKIMKIEMMDNYNDIKK